MSEEAGPAAARPTIVVESALAARQWEAQLAAGPLAAQASVFEAPPIRVYHSWLEELWLLAAPRESAAILAPSQSGALWRRVIAESPAGDALLGHAGAAEWAAAAATLLSRWSVDPAAQRAGRREDDFRAFLDWERRYRQVLRTQGWRDRSDLERELPTRPVEFTREVLATDLVEPYPARSALFAHLARGGGRIVEQTAPEVRGPQHAACLPDASHEVRAAFAWARAHIERQPRAKLAVIVWDLDDRRDEIARAAALELGTGGGAPCWLHAGALARDPAVGAAVSALSLFAAGGAYAAFGRWLRSPFFGAAVEQSARARLDRELRDTLRSRVPFIEGYYGCGVREALRERAPLAAQALTRALAVVEGVQRAAPSRWAHLWTRYLAALEWQPPAERAALLGWQNALDEMARLTPIVGEISRSAALAELERIVERASLVEPLPLYGVHVLRHIDEVGPGYDGVWVSGFTDAVWPEPPRGNPLLPVALQRELGLPFATPQDAERRSRNAFARLMGRAGELVVSWPARVFDFETEPSPAIASWEMLRAREIDALGGAPTRRPSRARETVADAAPPFTAARLRGGTGALGRQARCPVRAFCEDRLGARPLEPLRFGIDARMRGIAAHRAAELLLADLPTQEQLLAKPAFARATAARKALDEVFGPARSLLETLWQLELERLDRQLAAFLRAEGERAPFRVRALEQSGEVLVGSLRVRVRVDRLDELADGALVVIDYKTNERASGADWFAARLRDAQVPLYASHASEARVGAAVIARLTAESAGYGGIWRDEAFPGRCSPGAVESIDEQLALWRAQVATLAAEFLAGDVRIFRDDYEDALGSYAPLTRVHEQLGLENGATVPW